MGSRADDRWFEPMTDLNGDRIDIGDAVTWQDRLCRVMKFDKKFPSGVEIDDPRSKQKFAGAKKSERWVLRCEVEKV